MITSGNAVEYRQHPCYPESSVCLSLYQPLSGSFQWKILELSCIMQHSVSCVDVSPARRMNHLLHIEQIHNVFLACQLDTQYPCHNTAMLVFTTERVTVSTKFMYVYPICTCRCCAISPQEERRKASSGWQAERDLIFNFYYSVLLSWSYFIKGYCKYLTYQPNFIMCGMGINLNRPTVLCVVTVTPG